MSRNSPFGQNRRKISDTLYKDVSKFISCREYKFPNKTFLCNAHGSEIVQGHTCTIHCLQFYVSCLCVNAWYGLLLLLLLALQPTVSFSLLSDSLPFYSFFTSLSPPSYSHYLRIFFNVYNPSLPWPSSNSRIYR